MSAGRGGTSDDTNTPERTSFPRRRAHGCGQKCPRSANNRDCGAGFSFSKRTYLHVVTLVSPARLVTGCRIDGHTITDDFVLEPLIGDAFGANDVEFVNEGGIFQGVAQVEPFSDGGVGH